MNQRIFDIILRLFIVAIIALAGWGMFVGIRWCVNHRPTPPIYQVQIKDGDSWRTVRSYDYPYTGRNGATYFEGRTYVNVPIIVTREDPRP